MTTHADALPTAESHWKELQTRFAAMSDEEFTALHPGALEPLAVPVRVRMSTAAASGQG
jgi:hypothetical protein